MTIKVFPRSETTIEVAPSEKPGYDVAMVVNNEYVDAVLLFTEQDVRDLIAQFAQYVPLASRGSKGNE